MQLDSPALLRHRTLEGRAGPPQIGHGAEATRRAAAAPYRR
jgi:hypothetical protein